MSKANEHFNTTRYRRTEKRLNDLLATNPTQRKQKSLKVLLAGTYQAYKKGVKELPFELQILLLRTPLNLVQMIKESATHFRETLKDLWQVMKAVSERPWMPPLRVLSTGYSVLATLAYVGSLPLRLLLRVCAAIFIIAFGRVSRVLPEILPPFLGDLLWRVGQLASFVGFSLIVPSPLKEVLFWAGCLRVCNILNHDFTYKGFNSPSEEDSQGEEWLKTLHKELRSKYLKRNGFQSNGFRGAYFNLRRRFPKSVYWSEFFWHKIKQLMFIGLILGANALSTHLFGAPPLAITFATTIFSWAQAAVVVGFPVVIGIGVGIPLVVWAAGTAWGAVQAMYAFGCHWYERWRSSSAKEALLDPRCDIEKISKPSNTPPLREEDCPDRGKDNALKEGRELLFQNFSSESCSPRAEEQTHTLSESPRV